jgi:RHS repeat-associated protein
MARETSPREKHRRDRQRNLCTRPGILMTGKDYDDTTDLYYFNARWYDPAVGRFLSWGSQVREPAADEVAALRSQKQCSGEVRQRR